MVVWGGSTTIVPFGNSLQQTLPYPGTPLYLVSSHQHYLGNELVKACFVLCAGEWITHRLDVPCTVCNHLQVLLVQDPGTTCPHLNPERFAFPGMGGLVSSPKGNAPTIVYAPHAMSQLIGHGTVIRFPRSRSTSAVSVLRVYQPPLKNIFLVRASM